ncbi:hypothetical protein FN846DRAFT_775426 [Sphaerosporella brunnea]|uniref:Nuclear pore complex protein Nup85 n=1 Tax=Sphaerosporella brunnea TaxID=1250544 RepID=A0A5J5F2P5_9PEZI|nr:hypothetical protein FN846DRAFT_775426 [Sphaerosporella brunnea]
MWTREVNSPQAFEEDQFEESYEGYELQHLSQGQYHSLVNHRRQLQLAQLASVMETIADNRPINPTDSLEITAGGAMAFDPSFIDQLAKYSPLVGAAVVEIGGWGGWVKRETTPKEPTDGGTMGFLDEEDLAVLETGAEEVDLPAKAAEDLLRQYASSLFGTTWVNEDAEIEGWQIGMNVLKRTKDGKELASSLLTQLPLTSTPRVEKLLKHTTEQGLEQTASDIAFNWATHLQSNTQNYGDILHFLALAASFNADARKKLHEITTFLLEQSLLSSGPFPAKNETDPRLQHLLSSPSECASEILRFEISGYAALRTFYALRESAPGTAVKALTAVIRAAGEPIDGGVWDKEWESPVEPTVLPAVLRELLTCADAIGVTEALDVCKVLTDWEACGESLRKASVEVGPEGSWVDLGNQGDVVKRVRQRLCGVLARGWLKSGE